MPTVLRGYRLPIVLLGIMFILMLASSWNDSAIMDELAHVPAGYAYVFLKDYRLNPEHPPLAKMLAALPLAFTSVRFPTDTKSWADDVNGQWDQGRIFLYESGNNADTILRLMRLPGMLLAVVFGWLFWAWTRRRFDNRTANLTLFFFAFSPTFLAHSRFVTTDLAAAFGFFIGIVAFLRFLKAPTGKNIAIAGIAFSAAQLLKFSLILLLPVWAILLVAWAASRIERPPAERLRIFGALLLKTTAIGFVALVLISAVYGYAVSNYPPERQYRDTEFLLSSFGFRPAVDFTLSLISNEVTRPLGQYLLGLLMVIQRSSAGNTQYFLGEVSAAGDTRYFPLLYLLKEPLAFHILSLVALWFALRRTAAAPKKSFGAVLAWVRERFPQFSAITLIAIYWASSLSSPLNIGVRHVLPTFPFIYLLVAKETVAWLRSWGPAGGGLWRQWIGYVFRRYVVSLPRYLTAALLLAWIAVSVTASHPSYLSYYNFLGGRTAEGYRIAVDSNYDWGQDLKRLAIFAEREGIQKIRLDYFGGGSPSYYLDEKFQPWGSAKGYPSTGSTGSPQAASGQARRGEVWFAVSATFQMGAYGAPAKGFARKPEDSYEWLKPFRPVARAGTSIFIYHLPGEPPPGL